MQSMSVCCFPVAAQHPRPCQRLNTSQGFSHPTPGSISATSKDADAHNMIAARDSLPLRSMIMKLLSSTYTALQPTDWTCGGGHIGHSANSGADRV